MITLNLVHCVSHLISCIGFEQFPLLREWWESWGANYHSIVTRIILISKLEAGGVDENSEKGVGLSRSCTSFFSGGILLVSQVARMSLSASDQQGRSVSNVPQLACPRNNLPDLCWKQK